MNMNKYRGFIAVLAVSIVLATGSAVEAAPDVGAVSVTTNAVAKPADTVLDIVVTARKAGERLQELPGAVSVETSDMLVAAGVSDLRDAARYVPNLVLSDFTARRLSFPYMRGIGSGRNNPAVTTVIDGVPQLSYATANQQMLDVERIEILRGAQGALYGRNAMGGVINIVPALPGREQKCSATVSGGDFGFTESRLSAEGAMGQGGPVGSISAGYSRRDGYTENDLTGNKLDDREAYFGRIQVVWPETGKWNFRLGITGESDRDGDYAFGDLAAIRANPHHVSRDYEGSTERDLGQPVFTAVYSGSDIELTSVTAFQWWKSEDLTDLDYTPGDLMRRSNNEEQRAYTEELRVASPDATPLKAGEGVDLRWMLGTFVSRSSYEQRSFSDFRPGAVQALGLPFPYDQHGDADLDDTAASLFGRVVVILDERTEFGVGLRHDFERREADLASYTDPQLMPGSGSSDEQDFNQTSPQVTMAYHLSPDAMTYVEASKGYKAGGFNAVSVPGHGSFDEETSWTYEAGLKTSWLKNRVVANAAVFRMDWSDLQMDVPTGVPSVFYLDNVGEAWSQGIEMELTVRPVGGLELMGGVGLMESAFGYGSASGGADVGGNELPFAPGVTWHAGMEYSCPLYVESSGFIRVEGIGTGDYYYDAVNGESQESYTLVNSRIGLVAGAWRFEGWVKNIFDEDYVPVAFPYAFAASGYIGENGAPRTVGASASCVF